MDVEFWKQRWVDDDIGWHNSDVNPTLVEHWSSLGLELGARVLVPLCGKSLDMAWLAEQGYRVVGVEVSSMAAEGFFRDRGFPYRERLEGAVRILEWDRVTIVVGDIFEVLPEYVGHIDAVYDRAATVALPVDVRTRYAKQLARLAGPSARGLLLTIAYPQAEMDGPPFSVSGDEIERLYGERYALKQISVEDVIGEKPVYRERGVSELLYQVHLLGCDELSHD